MLRTLALGLCISLGFASYALGAFVSINTDNSGDVAAFQAGATVITFESLTGQNTLTGGTPIAPTSQLKDELKASDGVFFTSGGNEPIAVLDVTGIGKARSGKNVVAPLDLTNPGVLCDGCFFEVFFTSAQNKFGGWFDNANVQMFIFWTDGTQDGVTVPKGNFAGGTDTAKTIDHVTLLFTTGGGVGTMDDLTFGGGTPTVIPEPTTSALIGAALLVIGFARKKMFASR